MITVGPCLWESLDAEDHLELQAAVLKWNDAGAIIEYHADWEARVGACGMDASTEYAAEVYAEKMSLLALLNDQGISEEMLLTAKVEAPLSTQAAMQYGWRLEPEVAGKVWPSVLRRLGLSAPEEWTPTSSAPGLVVRYYEKMTTLERLARENSPDTDGMWRPGRQGAGEVAGTLVADPAWNRVPSKDEMIAAYPLWALEQGVSATIKVECVVQTDGRMGRCKTLSLSPSQGARGSITEYDVPQSYYRLAPIPGGFAGRTVIIEMHWPFGE